MEALLCQIPLETNGSCSFHKCVTQVHTYKPSFFRCSKGLYGSINNKYISNFLLYATHICSSKKTKPNTLILYEAKVRIKEKA